MNEVWNLERIYPDFDAPAFCRDMQELEQTVQSLSGFVAGLENAEPLEGLRTGIALQEKVNELANKLALYASLRMSANTRDGEAGSRMGQIMALLSGTAGPQAAFNAWASKLPDLMELVEGTKI